MLTPLSKKIIMIHTSHCHFDESWISYPTSQEEWVRSKLKKFNENQINTVIQFLIYSAKLDTIDEFNKEDIKRALNKVQSFKSE